MSSQQAGTVRVHPESEAPYGRRWIALVILALVQGMLAIDTTVVNIALPSIQADLGFSPAGLAWVVNAYTLTAGGFLLLGGRIADLISRKRLFLIGVALFAVASLASGVAQNPATMVAARFVQGLGVAVVSPAALSLAVLMFRDRRERAKAIGIWGGISGAGATFGVVIGGVVTSALDWRWIFLINLPIAAAVLLSGRLIPDQRPARKSRLELVGAALITAGLTLLIDGLLNASGRGWGSIQVSLPLAAGAALLVAFVISQAVIPDPLVPLGFFRDRTRASANVATILAMAVFMAMFFLLTLYMQDVGHYSPLRSGLAYLPFGIAMLAAIYLSIRLLPRVSIKYSLVAAFLLCAAGTLLLGQIGGHLQYASHVLPATIMYGFAQGIIMPGLRFASLHRTGPAESGLASGLQNTTLQVGSSLGLAVLVTIALRRTAALTAGGTSPVSAAVGGYVLAFRIGAAVLLAAAVLVMLVFQHISAVSLGQPRAKRAAPGGSGA
ncbi:MAG TPA: MFS transporter [Trebonia sp.]|nr:MFS transporter [Trebonia sp.]